MSDLRNKKGEQAGTLPYQYKCPHCKEAFVATSWIIMKQIEDLLIERDNLRAQLADKKDQEIKIETEEV